MTFNRFGLFSALLVTGLILSGCGSDDATNEPGVGTGASNDETVEIFSWWTAGGEYEALNALINVFSSRHPDTSVANSFIAGGGGFNARDALGDLFRNGTPPDTFQVHAGHELIDSWVKEGTVEPVTALFVQKGWINSYPRGLIDILSAGGEIWSVPVNIHRSNILWYDTAFFKVNGLSPPKTFDEFFTVAAKIEALGITPLALGDSGIWASTHLFETVLLGAVGNDTYRGLWDGSADWNGADVTLALETFVKMLSYANADHSSLSWDDAAGRVAAGEAAMTIMGDWVEGYFKSQGLVPGSDFGWQPTPQTAEAFMLLSDSFALSKNAANREAALKWLSVCGSKEGQDAFNPVKGAIPVHADANRGSYDVYQQSAMDDFASLDILPSVVHGSAASEKWLELINETIDALVRDGNIGIAQQSLAAACGSVGICK